MGRFCCGGGDGVYDGVSCLTETLKMIHKKRKQVERKLYSEASAHWELEIVRNCIIFQKFFCFGRCRLQKAPQQPAGASGVPDDVSYVNYHPTEGRGGQGYLLPRLFYCGFVRRSVCAVFCVSLFLRIAFCVCRGGICAVYVLRPVGRLLGAGLCGAGLNR